MFYNSRKRRKKKEEEEEVSKQAIIWRVSSWKSLNMDKYANICGKDSLNKLLAYYITLCSHLLPKLLFFLISPTSDKQAPF